MANLQAVVRAQSTLAVKDLSGFVSVVNKHVFENTTAAAYATLFFGEYNEDGRKLRYVNCGHPPALLVRADGKAELLHSTSTVLGLFSAPEVSVSETRLEASDTLLLYTDGVTECVDESGSEFGVERLIDILRKGRELAASALLDLVVAELNAFSGDEQQDDVTLAVVRCCGID